MYFIIVLNRMNQQTVITQSKVSIRHRYAFLVRAVFAGLLLPLGFAPFHIPGMSILGLALLFAQLRTQSLIKAFLIGFGFGIGFFGLGASWVYVSIHEYGHLNFLLSGGITLLFVLYLSILTGLVTTVYCWLAPLAYTWRACLFFSSVWCLGELLRATFLGGFPWLLLGYSQIDTPLRFLLPIIGLYGVGFLSCLAAALLACSLQPSFKQRLFCLLGFVGIFILPASLQSLTWSTPKSPPIPIHVIQANLSMRDKWDEHLFWQLLMRYKTEITKLLPKHSLIVLPESAIPLPIHYISDILETIDEAAQRSHSALLFGNPQPANVYDNYDEDEIYYYNALLTLGQAKGHYFKQHLIPFGEFIPPFFKKIMTLLGLPIAASIPGGKHQPLIQVYQHPIAALICYDIAYPQLLRAQLPKAEWIVSVSDVGWFGHSLAMYQEQQITQVLALQTARYHIVANNDGLSSVVDPQGHLVDSLPAFTAGTLASSVTPMTGTTPWVRFGDKPILLLLSFITLFGVYRKRNPR